MKTLILTAALFSSLSSQASELRCFAVVTGDRDDLKVEMIRTGDTFAATLGAFDFAVNLAAESRFTYEIVVTDPVRRMLVRTSALAAPQSTHPTVITASTDDSIVNIACYSL